MEPNDASLNALREAINRTLTHDNSVRKQAEAYLQGVEATPGFPRCLLALVERHSTSTSGAEDRALRQAASVMFKNMVKRRWQPAGEYEDLEPITAADREPIKGALVDLLGRTPPDVQAQLAEAVTIVAAHDFPSKWQWLLPQLSQSLLREDMLVTHGVMLTANSIMKRFRYVEKSDHLYADLLHCLESFSAPLQTVFTKHWARVEALTTAGGGRATVDGLLSTLRLIARVFYSLNWQDLPEQFEDNMPAWMTVFAAVLRYRYLDRTATDDDDDQEAAPLEQLQVAVLENINLYVEKYEEEFLPHLPTFTTAVWALLLDVGPQARLDGLATQGIQFLSTLAGKKTHGALFTQQVLADIVQVRIYYRLPRITSFILTYR